MQNTLIEALSSAIIKIATPFARILLKNGVSYGLFSEITKHAFVKAATANQLAEKRKATVTSIASLTGLTRKDVKRILETPLSSVHADLDRYNRAVKVISGWINNSDYLDQMDAPLILNFNGDEPSFSSLVKAFSGDMTPRAMLHVLQEAKCVEVLKDASDERITLVKHAYIPELNSEESIKILGADTAELITTIEHNLNSQHSPDDHELDSASVTGMKWYQRKVSNHSLDKKYLDDFKQLSSTQAQALLEKLDAWLTAHETEKPEAQQSVSLGIFYNEKDSTEKEPK